jgi:hypothetical protein
MCHCLFGITLPLLHLSIASKINKATIQTTIETLALAQLWRHWQCASGMHTVRIYKTQLVLAACTIALADYDAVLSYTVA